MCFPLYFYERKAKLYLNFPENDLVLICMCYLCNQQFVVNLQQTIFIANQNEELYLALEF